MHLHGSNMFSQGGGSRAMSVAVLRDSFCHLGKLKVFFRHHSVTRTPGDNFNCQISLNISQLFLRIVFIVCVCKCECACLPPLSSSWSAVLWESDIPIDLQLPRECVCMRVHAYTCVCMLVCPHNAPLSSFFSTS